jgi:chemotaxis protein CheD
MAIGRNLPAEIDRGVVTTVHQGECFVSGDNALAYATVLGSCIAACIRDVVARVGGMNHFLLAAQSGTSRDRYGASARYGAFAMEQLINMVLTRGTGKKSNLQIKVFGGGMLNAALTDIGAKNIAFVREFLDNEGYRMASHDLGGTFARKVVFQPSTGRAFVRRLDSAAGEDVAREEIMIARRKPSELARTPEIELF